MAFGDVLGTGGATTGSITNPFVATVSIAVSVGDLVIAAICEEVALTATAVTDNLGNTYVASNAGTLAAGNSGRMFYSRVTVGGTLTTVNYAATASSDNSAASVAVFAGPFIVSPVDKNPANSAASLTNCPATGPLSQANEVVIGWGAANAVSSLDGMSVGTLAVTRSTTNVACSIGYTVKTNTSGVSHVFTSTGSPSQAVLGTTTFKADVFGQPTVKRFGGVPFAYSIGRGVW